MESCHQLAVFCSSGTFANSCRITFVYSLQFWQYRLNLSPLVPYFNAFIAATYHIGPACMFNIVYLCKISPDLQFSEPGCWRGQVVSSVISALSGGVSSRPGNMWASAEAHLLLDIIIRCNSNDEHMSNSLFVHLWYTVQGMDQVWAPMG